jgi:hypothetical protein
MVRAITTLGLVLLTVLAAQAQITINSSRVPHTAGAQFQYYSLPAGDSALVDIGQTGGPQVWDFTTGNTSTVTTDLYLNPAQSPPEYSRANVVVQTDQLGLFGLSGPGIMYYWLGTPRYILAAVTSDYQGTPVAINFNPYLTQLALPLSLGRTWSNQVNLDQIFNVGGQEYRIQLQSTLNSQVDAWGIANVPLGNYEVLRTRTNVTYNLTISIHILFIWVPVSQTSGTSVNYDWRAQNVGSVATVTAADTTPGQIWTKGLRRLMNHSASLAAVEPALTGNQLPATSDLKVANYPNPFNAQTVASYELRVPSYVSLQVFDLMGKSVATLEDGWQEAGSHQITWAPQNLSTGAYYLQLRAGDQAATEMLLYLK